MRPDRERLLQTFLDIIQVPSPSRQERVCADILRERIEKMGYTVEEDGVGETFGGDCGNLFVTVPATGEGPALLLAAHIDTVEIGDKPIVPVIDGASIRSDGTSIVAADDKAGVAVLVELLTILKEEGISHGPLLFVFSVAEEKELLGALAMDPARYEAYDAGIVLDHASPTDIIAGAPTKLAIQILVNGVGGHGAFPERRINAAHVLARTLARLPSKRLDTYTTANLGIMQSGTAINIIPDQAYAEYELRSHREDLLDFHLTRILTSIEASVREARIFVETPTAGGLGDDHLDPAVRKATVEVDVCTCYSTYHHEDDALPVQLLKQAIEATGEIPRMVTAQGGSDANAFNARGLPTAVIGCGMHGAHSTRERADLDEMAHCVEILMHAISGA